MAKTRSARPRRDPANITRVATEALELANEDRALLEPRLDAGFLDGANEDLAQVVPVVSGITEKRVDK